MPLCHDITLFIDDAADAIITRCRQLLLTAAITLLMPLRHIIAELSPFLSFIA
jgi:hypothetical protein